MNFLKVKLVTRPKVIIVCGFIWKDKLEGLKALKN